MTDEELIEKMARAIAYQRGIKYGLRGKAAAFVRDDTNPLGVWSEFAADAQAALAIARPVIRAQALEEAASKVDKLFPPIHTHASENSERYHIQDETIRVAGRAIRALKDAPNETE